jgi:hypothetical protein
VRNNFLPFSLASIGEEEIAEVVDTPRSGWLTTGPKVKRFEWEFAAFVGAPAALALNSCTSALHLALVTLGIGPGDAVITTSMTFCSGVNVIEQGPQYEGMSRDGSRHGDGGGSGRIIDVLLGKTARREFFRPGTLPSDTSTGKALCHPQLGR